MLFMALVGWLGTFEGPIIGAIIFFILEDRFGATGVWYLVGLGIAATLASLLLPRGIWGTIEDRYGVQIMPVGYRLQLGSADGMDGKQQRQTEGWWARLRSLPRL
jgi:branched-chain amino acid transport system permease protein